MKSQRIYLAAAAVLLMAAQAPAWAGNSKTLRPEVGKPLQAAQKALQAKSYTEARSDIAKAESIGKLSPYEAYIIARLKASAAVGMGDYKSALTAYEQVAASAELPADEKLQVLDAYVKLAYTTKDYARTVSAIQMYKAAGGNDPQTLSLYAQALYLAGRYADAGAETGREIAAAEQAGRRPTDTQLQLLANCAIKRNDMKAYTAALEKVVTYTPKPQYWLDLILRTQGQAGFSTQLDLDVYRLRKATGTMDKSGDYMEAAQLALQAGFPKEAQDFVDEGYRKGLLGQGADAARDQRLKALVARKLAEDRASLAAGEKAALARGTGDALLNTGFNLVTYGDAAKGLSMMLQAFKAGGLKAPGQARLQLGYAYVLAGQMSAAVKVFAGIRSTDGAADLGRLWRIRLHAGQA